MQTIRRAPPSRTDCDHYQEFAIRPHFGLAKAFNSRQVYQVGRMNKTPTWTQQPPSPPGCGWYVRPTTSLPNQGSRALNTPKLQ